MCIRDSYLNSLQWDGQERIRYVLHHFFGAPVDELTYESMKMFLLGAIAVSYTHLNVRNLQHTAEK